MNRALFGGTAVAFALVLAGCQKTETDRETPAATFLDSLAAAGSAGKEWLSYGGTYDEQRHSRLTGINKDNVGDLGVAWTYDLKTGRGVETTPIVHDGVMYATSAWSVVHALDAKTGARSSGSMIRVSIGRSASMPAATW
jgi:quinohemoprotein ethanol dehydrogenase